MLISLLIPCMNRTKALRKALPVIWATAQASPPTEIVVLNYDSKDDLDAYLEEVKTWPLAPGNSFTVAKVSNKPYYHETHTRNCVFNASHGDYVVHLSAEALPRVEFVSYIRERIEKDGLIWMCENNHNKERWGELVGRFVVCQRQEYIDSGGYDERFEYYAPDDKDICLRLHRRGKKFDTFPADLLEEIPTSRKEKIRNLDPRPFTEGLWIRRQMNRLMGPILLENCARGVLVANEGKEWGKWN